LYILTITENYFMMIVEQCQSCRYYCNGRLGHD
jgi:hypothetical protein